MISANDKEGSKTKRFEYWVWKPERRTRDDGVIILFEEVFGFRAEVV